MMYVGPMVSPGSLFLGWFTLLFRALSPPLCPLLPQCTTHVEPTGRIVTISENLQVGEWAMGS